MLLDLMKTTLAIVVLVLPGIVALMRLDRRASWTTVVAIGSALGLAVATLGGYHVLRAGLPFVALVAAEWIGVAALVLLVRRRSTDAAPAVREPGGGGMLLIGLLVLVFASRAIPVLVTSLPLGTDPSFHALIAQKILLTSAIPTDWMPFEPVGMNYPVGPHLLIAEISRAAGVPVQIVFKCLFPIVACLTTLSVHSAALRLLGPGSILAARFAGLSFALLATWGSLDLYRWGGLPNAMGMLLLVSLAELAFHECRALGISLFSVIFAALVVVHHHAALCAGLLFAGHVVFTTLLARRLIGSSARIIAGLSVATLLAALPLVTYLRGGGEVGHTSVLRFYEPLVTTWDGLGNLGWPLVMLGVAGAFMMGRGATDERRLFLAWWMTLFFVAYVVFGQAWRFGALALDGGFYAAFTPTRFLTNLAQPLSIMSGIALAGLTSHLREGALRRIVPAAMVLAAILWAVPPLREQCADSDAIVDVAALEWIRANTSSDAFVVAESPWAPFFTWRETAFTPLPASEARADERVKRKREVLARDPRALMEFARESGRSVYIVVGEATRLQGLREVYRDERNRIFELQ